jgi:two-component system, OmpR family, response regulator
MMQVMRVLVVEDDPRMAAALRRGLHAERLVVEVAACGEDALALVRTTPFDAIVLDVLLPGLDGFEVCRRMRAERIWAPVIMLTARDAVEDRVRGLDAGADDYLTKPFNFEELRARIGAVLRRRATRREGPIRVGELMVDPLRRKVMVGQREVPLAKKEFSLLRVLAGDPTRVFSKEELLRDVWGYGSPSRTRTLDSHASRLRRKLDPEHSRYVVNCWGIGYRLLDG